MEVSITRIKAFKSCRRLYELRYIENMLPAQTPEALQVGKRYHEMLADLYNNDADLVYGEDYVNDYSMERAMARAYMNYIYPHFRVTEAEKHLEVDIGKGDFLQGYVDAIADDGCIVEHKTTSMKITEQYEYDLQWDEQILAYMLLTGKRKVYYTVCRKPNIRQKKDETDRQFFHRMLTWYDEDTEHKIRLLEIERTDFEVMDFEESLRQVVDDMKETARFYRNTCNCTKYGRRCEYSGICLHYDPDQQYIDYIKKEED